mgnify:CR=1 FL=1
MVSGFVELVCRVLLIFILPRFWGLQGVEICQMFSDILTFCLGMPMALHVLNQMKNETMN